MALSHDVLSAKRQRKAAKRSQARKNLKVYKQQMRALWVAKPEAFAKAAKEFPRGGKKK